MSSKEKNDDDVQDFLNEEKTVDIPGKRRSCTDVLFALLIICAWTAMSGVGLASVGVIESEYIPKGDPDRLTHGLDYEGNICGVSNVTVANGAKIEDLPVAYYLPSGLPVCIKSCPEEDNYTQFYCDYQTDALIQAELEGLDGEDRTDLETSLGLQYSLQYKCMPQVKSNSLLGYCYPKEGMDVITEATSNTAVNDGQEPVNGTFVDPIAGGEFFDEALADVKTSRDVILGFGFGISVLLGFTFLILLRIPGMLHIVVWGFIAAILAALLGSSYYMKETSERWDEEDLREDREVIGILVFGYVLAGLAALWVVVVCCMRKRIVLAIECIREASTAISRMPVIVFYPVIQVAGLLAFLIVWGIIIVYLAASGEVVPQCICPSTEGISNYLDADDDGDNLTCEDGCFLFKSFDYSTNTKYAGLYMLFIWFWTAQFVIAVGEIVTAMSISTWYFTREKSQIGNKTFFNSMVRTMTFHLGTAAFGSLIIAIVQTIRAIILYVEKTAVKREKSGIAKAVLKAIRCCLWCVEKCLKFINKNAYIQTAIFGYSFCKGARTAFTLLLRNVLRVTAVSVVCEFVLFVGKIFIVTIATGCAYVYLDENYSDQLNGLWLPTLLIAAISYCTAEMFSEVIGMTVSTILQCFITDEEMFQPDQRFARRSLAATINKTQAARAMAPTIHPRKSKE
mmetsp:Transcript_9926/g.14760  ORF Transcript_9926/g.14760 Transcript_9926/m.14760 type:complete len:681 (-) Transcript_9926:285-2327(-)